MTNIVGENRWWQKLLQFYLPMAFFVIFLMLPFYWMVVVSLQADRRLCATLDINPFLLTSATLEHYRYLFEETDFVTWTQEHTDRHGRRHVLCPSFAAS